MFFFCSNLKNLILPKFNKELINTTKMFYGCQNLKSVSCDESNKNIIELLKNPKEEGINEEVKILYRK